MTERLSEERQQEAEVRELRQELAARAEDNLRLVGTLREVSAVMGIPDDEPIAKAAVRIMGELIELQQRAEQAEAQMAMLVGKLIDVATGYRRDAAEEGCDAGNFDGGSTDTCAHCQLLQQAEGIDSLLATLPASANQMLELEKMRAALEWYADEGHWQDGVAGWLREEPEMAKLWGPHWSLHFCRDNGQRAREALRKEDTATDA